MAIGNTPNAAQLNYIATQVAVGLLQASNAAQSLANYVSAQGQDDLVAAGFSQDDAAAFLNTIGTAGVGQLTAIFYGQPAGVIAAPVDFSALLVAIAGPIAP
jgi:hypothetical protein